MEIVVLKKINNELTKRYSAGVTYFQFIQHSVKCC